MNELMQYSAQLDEILPTLEHHKQICYYFSKFSDFYNIDTMTMIEIQFYMFNMTIERLVNIINHIKTYKFYIKPNTYTNTLTLHQFFRCINDEFATHRLHTKKLKYKYNIFYNGQKFKGNVLENLHGYIDGVSIHRPPIDISYLNLLFSHNLIY